MSQVQIDHNLLMGIAKTLDQQAPRGVSFFVALFPSDGEGDFASLGNGGYRATAACLREATKEIELRHAVHIPPGTVRIAHR